MYMHDDGGSEEIIAIIPAFNEELAISSVVKKTKEYVNEVIVVDDGSKDETSKRASEAGAKVVRLEKNKGKAFALKTGFEEAKVREPSVIVMLDGDGQHFPSDIPKVAEPVLKGESDLVIGSRFLNNGHEIPKYRQVGQKVLNEITNLGAKNRLTDTQSGFRALSKTAVSNMNFNSVGYSIESDMIVNLSSRGMRIREVPVSVDYSVANKHKKNSAVMGMQLLNNGISFVGYKRPLLTFGVAGLFSWMLGTMLGLLTMSGSYVSGWSWLFQSMVSGFLLMLGAILIVSGLALNSIAHLVNSFQK